MQVGFEGFGAEHFDLSGQAKHKAAYALEAINWSEPGDLSFIHAHIWCGFGVFFLEQMMCQPAEPELNLHGIEAGQPEGIHAAHLVLVGKLPGSAGVFYPAYAFAFKLFHHARMHIVGHEVAEIVRESYGFGEVVAFGSAAHALVVAQPKLLSLTDGLTDDGDVPGHRLFVEGFAQLVEFGEGIQLVEQPAVQVGLEGLGEQCFAKHGRLFEGEHDEVFVLEAAFVHTLDAVAAFALRQQEAKVAHQHKIAFHGAPAQAEVMRKLVLGAAQRRAQTRHHLQKPEDFSAVVHRVEVLHLF